MGAFLDKPKTDKITLNGEGCGIRYGVSAMQGWRMEMEDSHVCNTSFGLKDHGFFGVFDGHAGAKVSKYCSQKLLGCILEKYKKECKSSDLKEALGKAIKEGFLQLDSMIQEKLEDETSDFYKDKDRSGSTAVVAMVTPDWIIWGNCGDSRGILCRNGKVHFATEDHKPYNIAEKARIERAGGTVMLQRVNGSLAVSRALGDFDYKRSTDLPATSQLVSPEPEIEWIDRNEENDTFLFLACDGIYDVMTNEEVVTYVLHQLELTSDLSSICSNLIDTCLHKNSRDNMSAILVTFPNAPKVSPEAIEKEKKLQEETYATINSKLQELVEAAGDPTDLEENNVIEGLIVDLPWLDISAKKDYISEKLAALKKGKFGEMVDFSGPSDPSEAPQEFQYTTTDAFYTQPESEPMATSVDQKRDDPTITEVGLSPDEATPGVQT